MAETIDDLEEHLFMLTNSNADEYDIAKQQEKIGDYYLAQPDSYETAYLHYKEAVGAMVKEMGYLNEQLLSLLFKCGQCCVELVTSSNTTTSSAEATNYLLLSLVIDVTIENRNAIDVSHLVKLLLRMYDCNNSIVLNGTNLAMYIDYGDHSGIYDIFNSLSNASTFFTDLGKAFSTIQSACKNIRHEGVITQLLTSYAEMLRHKNKLEHALHVHQECYSRRHAFYGDGYQPVAESANLIGVTLLRLQRFTDAESVLLDAMNTSRALLGDASPVVANIVANLGDCYLRLQDFNQAVAYYDSALNIFSTSLSENHPAVLRCKLGLAHALPKQAEAILHRGNTVKDEVEAYLTSYEYSTRHPFYAKFYSIPTASTKAVTEASTKLVSDKISEKPIMVDAECLTDKVEVLVTPHDLVLEQMATHDYQKALQLLLPLLNDKDSNIDHVYTHAELLRRLAKTRDDFANAINTYEACISRYTHATSDSGGDTPPAVGIVRCLAGVTLCYIGRGDITITATALEKALSVFEAKVNCKDDYDSTVKASLQQLLHYTTACAKFAICDFPAALSAVTAAITSITASPLGCSVECYMLQAEVLLEQWKFTDAASIITTLRTALSSSVSPVAAKLYLLQARVDIALGSYKSAENALQTASGMFMSLFGDAYFTLFECKYYECMFLYHVGKYEQASDKLRISRSHLAKLYPNSGVVRQMVQLQIACQLRLNDMKAVQQLMTNNFDQTTIAHVLLQEKLCCAAVAIEAASLDEAKQLLGEVMEASTAQEDVALFSWYCLLQGRLAAALADRVSSITFLLQAYTLRRQAASSSYDTLESWCYLALTGYDVPLSSLLQSCNELGNGYLIVLANHAYIDSLLTKEDYAAAIDVVESLQKKLLVDITVPQLLQAQTTLRLVECYVLQQQPTKAYEILQTCKSSIERDFASHSVRGWYGCLMAECDRQLKQFSDAKSIGTQTLSLLSHIFDTSHQQCLLVMAVLGLIILEQCDDAEECSKGEAYVLDALKQLGQHGYGDHRWYRHISMNYEDIKLNKPKPEPVVEAVASPAPEPTVVPTDNTPKLKELSTQNRLLVSQLQHCEKIIDDMKLHQAILESQKDTAVSYAESLQQIVNNLNGTAPKSLKQVTNRVTLAMRLGYAKTSKYKVSTVGVDDSL